MQSPSVPPATPTTPTPATQGPPLSPSSTTKPPELPGNSAPLPSVRAPPPTDCPVCVCVTDELVQAGWSKCWSRRENRPYYFNRFTNQSLWEVPVLGQHDVIVSDAHFLSWWSERLPQD